MADREKYIEVLSKTAKTVKEFDEDAPIKISLKCIEDILELLKEQEPASVKCIIKWTLDDDSNDAPAYSYDRFYDCPCCGQRLSRTYRNEDIKYCWKCGRRLNWDG